MAAVKSKHAFVPDEFGECVKCGRREFDTDGNPTHEEPK